MKQPDMGTLGVILVIALVIYFLSGARLQHLLGMLGLGSLAFYALVKLNRTG